MKRLSRAFIILLIGCLLFTVVPVPKAYEYLRPCWVAMLVIYFCFKHPRFLSLWWIFFIGLLLDTLMGSLLGQHALALVVVAALTLRFYRRIYVFPMVQKMLAAFILIFVYQFMLLWVDGVAGQLHGGNLRWWAAATSALVWPAFAWLCARRGWYA